ncbi:MAG TPA: TIGR01777 family oxidoreductase [Puia sp.]|nr:TIGR01777 family oxidoreductase [Puia sp.]
MNPPNAHVLITGGSGLIGAALSRLLLDQGYQVSILTRSASQSDKKPPPSSGDAPFSPRAYFWNPSTGVIDEEAIREADYIVHLAGAGVADKRWSAKRKKEIVESRTKSSALLVKALQDIPNKVRAVISASATGWYGPDPAIPNPRPFEETEAAADDFLGETCRLWEGSITPIAEAERRLVIIRTGIVLSKKGGALSEFKRPARLGVAAILGSGRQIVSWIHIDDLCRLFLQAIENKDWNGVYNGVGPQPVDNRTLMLQLARRLKGRYFVPVYVPSFLLKIIVGEMSIEVLKSVTVSAKKTRQAGFQFIYPSIESALADLV